MNPLRTAAIAVFLLAAPFPADAAPAPGAAAPEACPGGCPTTINDRIFYAYGTLCTGMNWRFLHAVAKAESGLDAKNKTGRYEGLFQLDGPACRENIRGFKGVLDCSDLYDPEANTAAAAYRFDRIFTGKKGFPSILETCPSAGVKEDIALAYIGHNNGPAVLKFVLKKKACTDEEIKKAIASFYEDAGASRDDGRYLRKDGTLNDCPNKKDIVGKKALRCVDAAWGIRKYEYGKKRISDTRGIDALYVAPRERSALCPATTGKRLFSPEEMKVLLAEPKKLNDEAVDAAQRERSASASAEAARLGEAAAARASVGAAALMPAAPAPGAPGEAVAPGAASGPPASPERRIREAEAAPAAQLPASFRRRGAVEPPDPLAPR